MHVAVLQVDILRPNCLLGSFDEFGRKFCTPEGEQACSPAAGSGRSIGGGRYVPAQPYQGCNKARLPELHKLLLANLMVRRTKAQVGLDLPSKTRLKVGSACHWN
jgi:SNF2 family DNA or RNA helicase